MQGLVARWTSTSAILTPARMMPPVWIRLEASPVCACQVFGPIGVWGLGWRHQTAPLSGGALNIQRQFRELRQHLIPKETGVPAKRTLKERGSIRILRAVETKLNKPLCQHELHVREKFRNDCFYANVL